MLLGDFFLADCAPPRHTCNSVCHHTSREHHYFSWMHREKEDTWRRLLRYCLNLSESKSASPGWTWVGHLDAASFVLQFSFPGAGASFFGIRLKGTTRFSSLSTVSSADGLSLSFGLGADWSVALFCRLICTEVLGVSRWGGTAVWGSLVLSVTLFLSSFLRRLSNCVSRSSTIDSRSSFFCLSSRSSSDFSFSCCCRHSISCRRDLTMCLFSSLRRRRWKHVHAVKTAVYFSLRIRAPSVTFPPELTVRCLIKSWSLTLIVWTNSLVANRPSVRQGRNQKDKVCQADSSGD